MAECTRFRCTNCSHTIDSWSDGNPYYIGADGKKAYAYHPSYLFNRCVGNDVPHLCLACGNAFKVDSRKPVGHCPKCKSENIVRTSQLEGKTCPFCHQGVFEVNPDYFRIS